jgi:hypothetical protein
MKKLLTLILTTALLAIGGCQKYDDSALWNEVNRHTEEIAALKAWQATVNGNITALDMPLGWTVEITREGNAGTFTITLPGINNAAGYGAGEVVVLAADGSGRTASRILRLTTSVASSQVWTFGEGGMTWYYYNWPYVDQLSGSLCPSPWRVPCNRRLG